MPHDIEELHRQASAFCIKADFEAALGLWRQVLELEPGDERAIEGIQLCERLVAGESLAPSPSPSPSGPDPAQEPAAAPVPSSDAIEELDFAIDDALIDGEVAPSSDFDAAQELRRRVEVLLQEARDHVERENVDEAEQVLVRVLILDEENQDALKLQQKIQETAGPDGPPTSASTADFGFDLCDEDDDEDDDEDRDRDRDRDEEEVEGQETLSLATLSPVEPSTEAPAVDDSDPDSAAPDSGEASEDKALATDKASKQPKSKMVLPVWATDRRVLLGAGGALVLVAVVFGLGLFGGEDSPLAEPVEATRAEKPVPAGGRGPEAIEEPPPSPVVQTDPALLLQEAQAAIEAEDWAAAVVAYNELLQQVPDHPVALENLPLAMEHYRQQRDQLETWNEAVSAFESGNFREALRNFYHMDGMDAARLKRYKVNGWYNLGVTALRGDRCLTALDHFDEALVIRPGDQGVIAAMALADACLDAGSPGAEVRGLGFRALED